MHVHLILLLLPYAYAANDDLNLLVSEGDAIYRDFRTRDAIALYTRAYELDKSDYLALSRLARAWSDVGRLTLRESDSSETYYRHALQYAEQLVAAHPDSASSWFLLALCHGSLTPFKSLTEKLAIAQDVERNALRALEIDPAHSMTYVLLGIYYRGVSRLSWMERMIVNGILGRKIEGTLEDSYRNLEKALQIDPGNSYAWYEMYWTSRSMGKEEEALAALRSVLNIAPTNERELQQKEDAERRIDRILFPQEGQTRRGGL